MLIFSLFSMQYTIKKSKENGPKINITPHGENFNSKLTVIKFKIWTVTFLKFLTA